MRFMVMVKADKSSEAGVLPSQELREQEERLRAQAAGNEKR